MMTMGQARREELDYLRMTVLVTAILSAGKVASGQEMGDHLKKSLKTFRSAMFPEIDTDLIAEAKKNEKLLEREFKRGPMQVQSLEYGSKRKKKRR
jgi:hypothetical protein